MVARILHFYRSTLTNPWDPCERRWHAPDGDVFGIPLSEYHIKHVKPTLHNVDRELHRALARMLSAPGRVAQWYL
ncbi:hypothetical protein MMC07_004448 [Pseudocyphellaria aurata]|nr:hypothetical protein [Pseudocyphellaria aurata]